jgi:hypothetical protein
MQWRLGYSERLRTSLTARSANGSGRLALGEGRLTERRAFVQGHWSF